MLFVMTEHIHEIEFAKDENGLLQILNLTPF